MPKPFYITTAIDYTNGAPHIGHAYEKVLADVIARYHRLKGEEVFFLTGVDQHGQKVQQSAEKAGVAPQQFVDEITAKFIALWEKLDVRYDGWAATTDPLHKECVQGNSPAPLRRRPDLQRQTGGLLQRPPGTVPDRQRARTRWRVRPRVGRGRAPRRRELLLPARRAQRVAARLSASTHPELRHPRFPPDRAAQRGRETERRPLHLAPEIAPELGDRATLRPRLRQLRLVRRPNELHQLHRLRSGRYRLRRSACRVPRQVARAAHHRQRHPHPRARHLLADHAPRARLPRRRKCRSSSSTAGGTSAARR